MPKNKTNDGQPGSARGQQVIEEAARLLRQLRFSQNQGAYAEGHHVAVSIDPRWNEDNETVHVLVNCYAFGHRRVDWEKLPVYVSPESGSGGVHAITRLDARGQTSIPKLPPGEYRSSLRVKPARVEPVLARQLERLAAQGEDEQIERRVWRGEEEGGAISWTIEETEEGDIQVAFETSAESLAGQVVVFSLIDPHSKQVRYSQRVILEPTRTSGKWEGWSSIGSRSEFPGPYEMLFEVVPPDEAGE